MIGIYIFTNKINNKKYVGQSVNISSRLYQHKIGKDGQYIERAIKKYGWDNFDIKIIECTEEILDSMERTLITLYNTMNKNFGYNLISGGHENKRYSDESKRKMSESHKGLLAGEKHPMYGKHHTEESKIKISDNLIGKFKGKENPFYGRHHTTLSKEKMSNKLKGKKHTEETKKKISSTSIGKKLSDETKKKISNSKKGLKFSEKHRNKLLESHAKLRGEKSPNARKIFCVELQIIFNCMKDAEKELNIKYQSIGKCCRDKRKTAGSYHWMYYEDYLKTKQEAS